MRSVIPTLILLAVAACASSPPPAPPELSPSHSALARAAVAEWEAWGRVTIDGWTSSWPDDVAATPDRLARLAEYWRAVPGGEQVVLRHARLRAARQSGAAETSHFDSDSALATADGWEDIGLYAEPAWSAAFVSAMARRAGIPERDLPSTSRHARYIDAVMARWRTDPVGTLFVPRAPEDQAPQDGDLLCADRSAAPLAHWTLRYASANRPRAMHCDVVVRTAPGMVEVIGGNVQGLVTLRRLPTDPDGRVLPAPPGFPPFVLLLVARDARPLTPIEPMASPPPEPGVELSK